MTESAAHKEPELQIAPAAINVHKMMKIRRTAQQQRHRTDPVDESTMNLLLFSALQSPVGLKRCEQPQGTLNFTRGIKSFETLSSMQIHNIS